MQFRKFVIALIEKTVERSPLKYKATRAVSCIRPSILYSHMTSEARMTDLLQIFHYLGRITSTEADDATAKFSELCEVSALAQRTVRHFQQGSEA